MDERSWRIVGKDVQTWRTLVPSISRKVPLRLMNLRDVAERMHKGATVAELQPVDAVETTTPPRKEERRVERLAEADTNAKRQELVEDLRWLFLSEAMETVVKETSRRVEQDDGTAKASADVNCVLGRESANLIELERMVEGSADVHCVL